MALTPTIRASQAGALVAARAVTAELKVTMAGALSVYNFPSERMDVSQVGAVVTTGRTSTDLRVSQAAALVVAKGRVYSPKLRAWGFKLDGHLFYVLRLGEKKTLVYDLTTQQWSWWTSGQLDFWRASIGMNWYSAGRVPEAYGSNIVVGDDAFGHLWVLSPEQGYDDQAMDPPGVAQRFPRVATGQLITRERQFVPIYEVYLTGSFGRPVEDGDAVEHLYSDDLGNTYVTAGALSAQAGDYNQEFAWRSLGLAVPAGRLFRIEDDGAFARIDSLDVEHGGANA